MTDNPRAVPTRLLHTMLRIHDIERSLGFYCDGLRMREFRRETFPEGKFTLIFIGYGDEANHSVIELTHNWESDTYTHGTGYGHIALEVPDVRQACARLERMGIEISRPAGPMSFAPLENGLRETIAFVTDPDGYRIELIEPRAA